MSDILGDESKSMRRSLRRTRSGLFLVLLLLLALVSSAYADQLCTVCHGPNGPHTPQCGDTTTCGVSCHQGKLDAIMHPSGAGTPISGSTTTTGIATACQTCHQFPGTTHPFRINTVPGTTTVYPDLNQSCGQCHGGGTDSAGSPPKSGVVYLTVNQLAVVAPNIHSGTTTSWLNTMDCTLCHNGSPIAPAAVSHPTGTGTPGTGAAACRSCHLANGILHQKAAVSVDNVCGQCHGGSRGAGAVVSPAPYFTETLLAESAKIIHDSNKASTVNCEACHATANPIAETLSAMGHPQALGTPGCIQCHTTLLHTGAAPVSGVIVEAACSTCHGTGGSAHKFTGFSDQPLSVFAAGIHTKSDPGTECTNCHTERPISMRAPDGSATMPCSICHISNDGARPGIPPTAAQACHQCHGGSSTITHNGAMYFTAAQLTIFAANIHGTIPTARFTWNTDTTKDYRVLYDASASTCPAGTTCTYSWSTGETGITASHTFISSATTTVTLTVASSSGQSNSTSQAVTPKYVASNPTSLGTGLTVTPNGFSPTVNWSVSGGVAPYTIRTNWGDGTNITTSQAAAGPGSLSHTYPNSGTYTVTVSATDSGDNGINMTTASASASVTIIPVTVSGLVTSATGSTLSSVSMTLSGAKSYLATTDASGNYTFPNVSPGTYTMTAVKTGYTFSVPAATGIVVDGTTNVTVPTIRAFGVADTINIAGKVTQSNGTTAIGSASLTLRLNGVFKALGSTNPSGNYTFANVANGTYTITAVKTGVTFSVPAATVIVSGASVTANFSSLTP